MSQESQSRSDEVPISRELLMRARNMCLRCISPELPEATKIARELDLIAAFVAPVSERGRNTDKERLDWLEMMHVEVRQPLVHGSHHLFHASPEQGDGDETPSDIRRMIDYNAHGGDNPRPGERPER